MTRTSRTSLIALAIVLTAMLVPFAPFAPFAPLANAASTEAGTAAPLSELLEARESLLAHHLRCVVCQNQTVAESNAPLAADMRQVIREQLRAGRADDEIVAFFEQRYGAFVRYSPPWQPSTWLLWTGPFLVLVVGLAGLTLALRRRGAFDPALDLDDEPLGEELEEGSPR